MEFDRKKYRTIADVRELYPISEKTIKKMVKDGDLPAPKVVRHGTRTFRHYPDEWVVKLAEFVTPRAAEGDIGG